MSVRIRDLKSGDHNLQHQWIRSLVRHYDRGLGRPESDKNYKTSSQHREFKLSLRIKGMDGDLQN